MAKLKPRLYQAKPASPRQTLRGAAPGFAVQIAVSLTWGALFVDVLVIRAIPIVVYIKAPDFWKLHNIWNASECRLGCEYEGASNFTETPVWAWDRRLCWSTHF